VAIGMQKQLVENLTGPMEVQGKEAGIWLSVTKLQQLVSSLPKTECDFQRISPATNFPDSTVGDLLKGGTVSHLSFS